MSGASRETLLRRVTYGGRKGRSAARRLRRMMRESPHAKAWRAVVGWQFAVLKAIDALRSMGETSSRATRAMHG